MASFLSLPSLTQNRLLVYGATSTALAASVVLNAAATRTGFYSAAVAIAKSNGAVMASHTSRSYRSDARPEAADGCGRSSPLLVLSSVIVPLARTPDQPADDSRSPLHTLSVSQILANFCLFVTLVVALALQRIFFGRLRAIEVEVRTSSSRPIPALPRFERSPSLSG